MTNQRKKPIDFNGIFTEKLRKRFKRHRRALNVTILNLADYLGIHWSIIRKWEDGITAFCHPKFAERIKQFLSKDFDDELKMLGRGEGIPTRPPRSFRQGLSVGQKPLCLKQMSNPSVPSPNRQSNRKKQGKPEPKNSQASQ